MIRMPLKLKLGRSSGRYELSDDIYILTVFIGDFPMAQCTLNSASTSADVFRYLGEKTGMGQPEIFGLQYQMKATDTEKRMMRWIEPGRPIRRQLERWACRRGQKWAVNLAILHACSNVFTLHDSVSRSVYYTLLKWDVLQSERLTLDLDKCINLAAYQMQIEFPDFRPTLQHLKMLSLLPQSLCRNPKFNNDDTYLRILTTYEKLRTMQPAYAALLYIVEIQQCEGYGEEAFVCKDGNSLEEVSLGCSLDWIFVRRPNGAKQKFRWEEVRELVANKRKLSIKCGENMVTSLFCFEDNEMARYVSTILDWKLKHARTDAQQKKSARLSMVNLQGTLPSFGQSPGSFIHRSNINMSAIRPNSEIVAGIPSSYQFIPPLPQPSTPQLSVRTEQTAEMMISRGTTSTMVTQPPVNAIEMISPPAPCTVESSSTFYISTIPTPSTPVHNPVHLPPPVAHTPPYAAVQQHTSNSSQENVDWLKNEQREVLKRMLKKRRLNKIGSSPEINTLGKNGMSVGTVASGAKGKRHQTGGTAAAATAVNASVGTTSTGFTLARKIFTSTPDLHSARLQQQQQNLQNFLNLQPQQQLMPQSQPQTPTFPTAHLNVEVGHRQLINQSMAAAFSTPTSSGNGILPAQFHSALTPSHTNSLLNGDSTNNGITTHFLLSQSSPIALRNSHFSQGQIIDEKGQQQKVIYPVPHVVMESCQPSSTFGFDFRHTNSLFPH